MYQTGNDPSVLVTEHIPTFSLFGNISYEGEGCISIRRHMSVGEVYQIRDVELTTRNSVLTTPFDT